jgi:outer membrane protein assembly factor BamB
MRTWLKRLAIAGAGVAAIAVGLRSAGYHIRMDGSGHPRLVRVIDADALYDALERQRAAQRESAPAAAVTAPADIAAAAAAPAASPIAAASATAATPPPSTLPVPPPPAGAALPGAWTDFRGPARDGVYRQRTLSATWPAGGPRLLWKQPIGEGHASFAIAGGVAYTIEQRREREVVAAYDVKTGRERWTHGWDAHFSESMGGDGPRATPTWAGGVVFALGAAGELRALTAATGTLVWRRNILEDAGADNLQWAMAGSPLVVDGMVVVQPGGRGASVVAYDAATGRPIWKSLDDAQAYVSPMLATLAGRRQILTWTAERVVGLAIEDGALLWSHPWTNGNRINATQPVVVAPNRVFVSTGYNQGATLIEIAPSGAGYSATEVWQTPRMKNRLSTSVLLEGHLYGLDEGILGCIEVATGRLAWKNGRYGHGQILLAGDRLVITAENGDLALVRATPAGFEELARVPGIEGRTWNVPAIDDGILLVRNAQEMAAFDLR